jgi:hypothetical protein
MQQYAHRLALCAATLSIIVARKALMNGKCQHVETPKMQHYATFKVHSAPKLKDVIFVCNMYSICKYVCVCVCAEYVYVCMYIYSNECTHVQQIKYYECVCMYSTCVCASIYYQLLLYTHTYIYIYISDESNIVA